MAEETELHDLSGKVLDKQPAKPVHLHSSLHQNTSDTATSSQSITLDTPDRPRAAPSQQTQSWWAKNIVPTLNHDEFEPRDFEALERTNLSYTRTANTFAVFGVLMTQVYIISDSNKTIGVVFATVTYVLAIAIIIIGCVRYFAIQNSLVQKTALQKGWSTISVWAMLLLVLLGLFVAVLVA